ncbi:MAG: precorrin-6A/cobalt-precorrin-6A reductase, partial [Clostridia bacterium]|nr:precorrin-6A/cobalt-precorrin-6A reductase [Clostridia bacterium]
MVGIVVFGGTVEGRETAVHLKDAGQKVTVSVTSEYARTLLPGDIDCRVG